MERRAFLKLAGGSLSALAAAKWPSAAPVGPLAVVPDESVSVSHSLQNPTILTYTTRDPLSHPGKAAVTVDFGETRMFSGVIQSIEIDVIAGTRRVTAIDRAEFESRRAEDYGMVYGEQDAETIARRTLEMYV